MLFPCMHLPPPHPRFSDAVLKTRRMLRVISLCYPWMGGRKILCNEVLGFLGGIHFITLSPLLIWKDKIIKYTSLCSFDVKACVDDCSRVSMKSGSS